MYDSVQGVDTISISVNNAATAAACQEITLQEVVRVIRNMKNAKAAGIDKVTAEMIKYGGSAV